MDRLGSIKERLETLMTLHDNEIYTFLFMFPPQKNPYITEGKI